MADINQKLNILYAKLQGLSKQQEDFSLEISRLKKELVDLKRAADSESAETQIFQEKVLPDVQHVKEPKIQKNLVLPKGEKVEVLKSIKVEKAEGDFNLEKFIGENLTNKIGVLILILGVAIGTKYSIDHNLVTPLSRIIIGYILSFILFGIGLNLKKKYLNLSAVLVSGAMASFYLVSYAAFAFFKFYSQWLAFLLLVLSTIGSIIIAISYKRQVIAQIGLVGAYAAPFLVSTGSNNVVFLFTYMAIINLAILFLAQRQQWKELFYSSFGFTYLIFFFWFLTQTRYAGYQSISLFFSSVFYFSFQIYYMVNRMRKKNELQFLEILILVLNSLFAFLVWYDILENKSNSTDFRGLFIFVFAAVNGISAFLIHLKNKEDSTSLYILTGFSILLLLIGIPVQFYGNLIPILYILLAACTLFIARNWKSDLVEVFFFPVTAVALIGFLSNLTSKYYLPMFKGDVALFDSVFNYNFLSSIVFCTILSAMVIYNSSNKYSLATRVNLDFNKAGRYLLPFALFTVIYSMVYMEIAYYWKVQFLESTIGGLIDFENPKDYATRSFNVIWQFNWILILLTIVGYINFKFWKNETISKVMLAIGGLVVFLFLVRGLFVLSDIRVEYLKGSTSSFINSKWGQYALRYVSILILALFVALNSILWKKDGFGKTLRIPLEIAFHIIVFWVACSELLRWMDFGGMSSAYKTGLSVMGGSYALILVGMGIWKNKTHLRIMAIALFGITLAKLFFYDISSMSMIAKTIVFIILGGLLLSISYLYNRYKSKIGQQKEE